MCLWNEIILLLFDFCNPDLFSCDTEARFINIVGTEKVLEIFLSLQSSVSSGNDAKIVRGIVMF